MGFTGEEEQKRLRGNKSGGIAELRGIEFENPGPDIINFADVVKTFFAKIRSIVQVHLDSWTIEKTSRLQTTGIQNFGFYPIQTWN